MKYRVPVTRIAHSHTVLEVEANSEEEALAKAKEEAGNHEFSTSDADYEYPDGAFLIEND